MTKTLKFTATVKPDYLCRCALYKTNNYCLSFFLLFTAFYNASLSIVSYVTLLLFLCTQVSEDFSNPVVGASCPTQQPR